MRSPGIALLTIIISFNTCLFCKAQAPDSSKNSNAHEAIDSAKNSVKCRELSSSLLLNSLKEKDDWQIISGPAITGVRYPVKASYSKPFPSWETDRYTADSSYFKNCDWMVLPDKKSVINTETCIPVVFTKRFKTIAPSKLKLIVKMLYDNMAWLYIDSTRITLSHPHPDINRFIRKLEPEFSGFVSLPGTFNHSNNASFYAGDFHNHVLPAGDHTLTIELFNNAYELGCIIKGMLISSDDEKIFCSAPIKEEPSELSSILMFRDKKAFPKSKVADTLYAALMKSVKTRFWINNLVQGDKDLMSQDTLFMKKGEKINITPLYITAFYDGKKDTVYARGNLRKITTAKAANKQWNETFVFNASLPGNYQLEINCETPADAAHTLPNIMNKYARVIKVK